MVLTDIHVWIRTTGSFLFELIFIRGKKPQSQQKNIYEENPTCIIILPYLGFDLQKGQEKSDKIFDLY